MTKPGNATGDRAYACQRLCISSVRQVAFSIKGSPVLADKAQFDIFERAISPAPAPVPRSLLVFAHPDDETIALGARLANFGNAHMVHVTDGAPRNELDSRQHGFATLADYRRARALELANVLDAAGLSDVSRECLRVPDQEACRNLALLTRTVARIIRQQRPEVIFTHPFEGGHPDHDACAFAVHHALLLLGLNPQPLVIEAAFYHAGPDGLEAGTFVPGHPVPQSAELRLTPEELRRKCGLLSLFTSQRETLAGFPPEVERYRVAPEYDFGRPPHDPPVLYDRYPWGTNSDEFLRLSSEAETLLNLRVAASCRSAS